MMVIDSGASINIIDESAFHTLCQNVPITLQHSTTRILAYGAKSPLPILGKFESALHCSTGSTMSQINVFKGNFGCLLSYQTASALGLVMIHVSRLHPEYTGHEQLLKEYTHLFNGIGTLKNFEVKLHINETVPPVVQPARRIPFYYYFII